jgi:spermidine synthase
MRTELLDTARIPGGDSALGLYARGGDLLIKIVGGQDLMSTRTHESEDALGETVCAEFAEVEGPRILIGGLGMGFTLSAALRQLGADAEIIVAELVPAVVEWNRGALGAYAGDPLRDERVSVREGDVSVLLRAELSGFDAIILDVDNGPQGLMLEANHWLYSRGGLAASYRVLRSGGVLAVWSAGPDRAFSKLLHKTGFEVSEARVRAHRGKGARHVIWMARKTGKRARSAVAESPEPRS